jgi:DNA-binding MarR family transcriptional regulator
MNSTPQQLASKYIGLIPLLFQQTRDASGRKSSSELTHLQSHLLEELFHEREGMAMSHLAKMVHISKQQLTAMIPKLEAKGYVIKAPDPEDKRSVRIRLTDQGAAIISRRWEDFHKELSVKLERLEQEDRNDLDYALSKITNILKRLD